ncbi:NAD(P)-dependent oxidoreductase [Streptomyces sp. NPDC056227]|uniref:NAD(P)-dependent oxidoreductase n=1 Tax=Streptomyces sp. NPDC056227 TaxID=3345753 RepID=UPI0035E0DA08
MLINTARGSPAGTAALTHEGASGRIGAVLDVTDPEPLPLGDPLLDLRGGTAGRGAAVRPPRPPRGAGT